MTKDKIHISPYGKVRVNWDDRPENYSREAKNRIIKHIASKYNIDKNNINVVYRPVKFNENGDAIEISGAKMENILDINYQRELMKKWLEREGKDVDFDKLLRLDTKVNEELNLEQTDTQHRTWAIRWLMINNFLCFGEANYLSFGKLKGLTVVNSNPPNQGGKTTLTIDTIKFLLHGSTTKTDKNEEIFNTYSEKNEIIVRGMIDIGNEETIIERKMKRSAKKGGGWTVTNKLNFYTLLPDGTESMQNEEDVKKTTAKLKETIGTEKDFEMLVLATENNLDDLIGLTVTESGKILTRLIGLEVIEKKEAVVRKMYNDFDRKKLSNQHNILSLSTEIIDHKEAIEQNNQLEIDLTAKFVQTKDELARLVAENERLLNTKRPIDVTISTMNPSKLAEDIEALKQRGLSLKATVADLTKRITDMGVINFDEDRHHELLKYISAAQSDIAVNNSQITALNRTINELINGGICQACNRQLDDVDNTEQITLNQEKVTNQQGIIDFLKGQVEEHTTELNGLIVFKKQIDDKNRLELEKDRTEVEIGTLRNQYQVKKNDLDKYNQNLDSIEFNKKVDSDVSMVKTSISVAEYAKDDVKNKITKVQNDIVFHTNSITTKEDLIVKIKKEDEYEKIFKIYIDLVGKKGISKLVLRSVLPIINVEVQRLLDGVCDFEIEIFMDDKNDVQFLIVKDGITKLLKSGSGFEKTASSLVLRCVLGKLSTLPMPNFITFDEVLGKVADENIEKLKPLFDRIKEMYDIVFLITHNPIIKDWSDTTITVVKKNNISSFNFLHKT